MFALVQENTDDWLQEIADKHKFAILVFYRGNWCPFCQTYANMWQELLPKIHEAGGEVYMVTSQSSTTVSETAKQWKSTLSFVCDEACALAKKYRVVVEDKSDYPHGMTQPAVAVLSPSGDELYHWVLVPSKENLGGVTDRVLPRDILPIVQRRVKGEEVTEEEVNGVGKTTKSHFHFSAMFTGRLWKHILFNKH